MTCSINSSKRFCAWAGLGRIVNGPVGRQMCRAAELSTIQLTTQFSCTKLMIFYLIDNLRPSCAKAFVLCILSQYSRHFWNDIFFQYSNQIKNQSLRLFLKFCSHNVLTIFFSGLKNLWVTYMWNNLAFEEQSNCLIVKCTGLLKICFDASDLNHDRPVGMWRRGGPPIPDPTSFPLVPFSPEIDWSTLPYFHGSVLRKSTESPLI